MIDIIIPTLHRPSHLAPLLANINEVTEVAHRTYFVCEESDDETLDALEELQGAHWLALVGDYGSCAAAMNAGFRIGDSAYAFTGNDDLWFHVGWDVEALRVREPITGTNDGHGRMTCFALAHRGFIEKHSGVYDKPATLWHEYSSQYPDTELYEYAKHRGAWGEAPKAITEHRHWEFGKADPDHPNYHKAKATVAADHATFIERRRAWQAQ